MTKILASYFFIYYQISISLVHLSINLHKTRSQGRFKPIVFSVRVTDDHVHRSILFDPATKISISCEDVLAQKISMSENQIQLLELRILTSFALMFCYSCQFLPFHAHCAKESLCPLHAMPTASRPHPDCWVQWGSYSRIFLFNSGRQYLFVHRSVKQSFFLNLWNFIHNTKRHCIL